MKRNFVVVAQDDRVREALACDLRARGYTVTRAASGRQAEQIVRSVAVDAVIVESHLPDMPPEELRARIAKLRPGCRVTVLTDFRELRRAPQELYQEDGGFLLRAPQVLDLVEAAYGAPRGGETPSFSERGNDALIDALDVVVGLVELDDRHFGGFSHQAMRLARAVAEELGAEADIVREIVIATLLRDLGKVGVEPELLGETGWYSPDQRERMKVHVEGSLRLFEHIDFPWKVLPIIRHHHERYDGNGHPDGLRGREIPLGARIVAAVDAFVALGSGRGHREPVGAEQALAVLVVEAGRQFDPEVVEALQHVLDQRSRQVRRSRRKPAVLLVAAEDENRRAIKMRLVNEGVEVVEVKSAARAMQRAHKDSPDLVLCDLDADAAAGFELLRSLREDAALARVPVAFLCGRADRILKLRALREGVDDFLSKQDELELLVARVQNILAREALRREGPVARSRRGITGDLENLALADIVQMLASGMKTACVTLQSGPRNGQIWFDNGAVRHAHAAGVEGEPAFFELVRWREGSFVIEHGVATERQSVTQDAMFLVMEGLRLLDEATEATGEAAGA